MCMRPQSCPTLCSSMDSSPPDSSVHGFFQTRTMEWVVISSSRGLPTPGFEPVSPASPALAGGFFTMEPQSQSGLISCRYLPQQRCRLFARCHESQNRGVELVSQMGFSGVRHYAQCDIRCDTHFCGCALGWVQMPGLCDLTPFSALHS